MSDAAHLPAGPPVEARATQVARYCEDLLLALRMRDVPGARIGAVLAEVRAHLADSGEDPVEAFGPATDYADALTAGTPPPGPGARLRLLAPGAALVLGPWWVVTAATALLQDRQARLSAAPVLAAVVLTLVAPVLLDRVVTASTAARVGWCAGAGLLVATLGTAIALLGTSASVPVPALLLLLPGAALTGWALLSTLRSSDRITDPLADGPGSER